MNETTEQLSSPLEKIHRQHGAGLREEDGWLVPATYKNTLDEYAVVRDGGAGLMDLSPRGRIRVSGSEAVMFLNGLITNDMKTLVENRWMPAAFPNVQGRLIAAVRVVRLGDEPTGGKVSPTFLLDTDAGSRQNVLKTIERFTLAGDFRVADVTHETTLLSVQGRLSGDILGKVLLVAVTDIPHDGVLEIAWNETIVTMIRASHTAEDGFDLLIDSDHAASLWEVLVAAGARPIGYDALEVLRVEAGIARYGRDMDETNVVTETNLDEAVSFTKGCYLGQEIIVRIKHRGHVAKKLTGLKFETDRKVEADARIKSSDNKEIGRVTSTVFSPKLGSTVGLGYVRYEHLAPGTRVLVTSGQHDVAATINELPLVRGSWYQG